MASVGTLWGEDLPIQGSMIPRVKFWKKVYTEISTNQAFIHDTEDLTVIYKKMSLPKGRRGRRRIIKAEKRRLKRILVSIAKKNYHSLSEKENQVANIIGKRSTKEIYRLARDIRCQYGLKDRYYRGLINSYRYIDYIKKVFKSHGVPERLIYLPHVESSFNYRAYSKVGAAGIWQFMRTTARKFGLKVGYVVDERRDILKATRAAAKLLKANYSMLKSWPLALTAYNHGPARIARAARELKTIAIDQIIDHYDGRRFGFASKNFYATFMATVEISEDPSKYFPSFIKPKPFYFSSIKLYRNFDLKQLMKSLNITEAVIKKYNPSIRSIAFKYLLRVPKGMVLYIPPVNKEKLAAYNTELLKIKKFNREYRGRRMHIIAKGENLYDILRIYKVSLGDIVRYNRIRNPSRIYAGMKLKIPGKDYKPLKIVAKSNKKNIGFVGPLPLIFVSDISLEKYQLDIDRVRGELYRVVIETEETLGHIADWAQVRAQDIRNLNGFSFRSNIRIGQKIVVSIGDQHFNDFKRFRNEYHLSIQEDFFSNFQIVGLQDYKIKRGDNFLNILKKFDLPYWLVRNKQSKDVEVSKLNVGQNLKIPIVENKVDD